MGIERKRGLAGDFERLKEHGGATAAELQEFMQSIKGRSPQEMLGVVAQSSLFQSVTVATIGCVVLLATCSAVPYAWGKMFPAAPAKAAPAQAQAAAPAPEAAKGAPAQPAGANQAALPTGPAADGDAANSVPRTTKSDDDLLNKLGVGETKTSDPNSNPLDSDKDDLLKEAK